MISIEDFIEIIEDSIETTGVQPTDKLCDIPQLDSLQLNILILDIEDEFEKELSKEDYEEARHKLPSMTVQQAYQLFKDI